MKELFYLFVFILLLPHIVNGQVDPSAKTPSDSFYLKTAAQTTKNKIWGNSSFFAASHTWASSSETDINVGRSYCVVHMSAMTMRTLGVGGGFKNKEKDMNYLVKCFAEVSTYTIFFPNTIRIEYVRDINSHTDYLRPMIGLNLFYVDLLYSYTFDLSGTKNEFRNGFTLRLKFYTNQKKWQNQLTYETKR